MSENTVAVVGAGLAGLACAQALRAGGRSVRLFDKGRGAGGRASTRRVTVGDVTVGFDHGAQYMTAHDPAFAAELAAWARAGLVAPWPPAGDGAWVGTPGMNAPLRHLAADLPVAWGTRVTAIAREGAGWRLQGEGAPAEPFAALVVALPAEQTAALVRDAVPALATLAASRPSAPCWTVLLAFATRLAIGPDVVTGDGDLAWAARNSAKPGRGATEAWVLQASPEWSRAHLEDAPAAVIDALAAELARLHGEALPSPLVAQAHRWRYARSARGEDGCWWEPAGAVGACGDWLLGPRVENAWLSGRRLAAAVLAG